ncbi:MAG: hypothetical protein IPL01_13545 [Acidobacteria bacterium]|nr:hypothetical protein [Acidobacteriota bacterium]
MHISRITSSFDNQVHRISATVMGTEVWFESPDVELRPSAEAFASAFLIPSLHIAEALEIDQPLDPVWLSNIKNILPLASEWWGYSEIPPRASSVPPSIKAASCKTGLSFSGGADSFYSLLRYGRKIDYLVFIQGFDMRWDDNSRLEAYRESLNRVASQLGAKTIILRTNIKEHPLFNEISWEVTHGGVLAAAGHLLGNVIDNFVISSSISKDRDKPWGSHWRIDENWSSSNLRITHFGAEVQRNEKLMMIASEPLVRSNLRVCWENRTDSGNCSVCEKCIRTRITLMMAGELENYQVFQGPASLVEDIDNIPCSSGKMIIFDKAVKDKKLSPELRRALRALIRRTKRYQNPVYQRVIAPVVRFKSRIFGLTR